MSGASSAAPERGVGVRAKSPITAAALSPFVLLAAKKNEQKHIAKQNRIYQAERTALPPFVLRAAKKNGQKHASLHCKSRPLIKSKKHIAKQTAFIGQRGRQPRREKGEDCLSGASSAAPERGVGVRANSPITAAALLGSFFSLLRRMNKNMLHCIAKTVL